jgi:hypothetical protein
VTILSLTSSALVLYALVPAYATMERGRFRWPLAGLQWTSKTAPAETAPAESAAATAVNLSTDKAAGNRTRRMDTMQTVTGAASDAVPDAPESDVLPDIATRIDAADSIPDTVKLDTDAVKSGQSDEPAVSSDDDRPQTVKLDTSAVKSGTDNPSAGSSLPDVDTQVFPAVDDADTSIPVVRLDTDAVKSGKNDADETDAASVSGDDPTETDLRRQPPQIERLSGDDDDDHEA